MVKMIGVSDLVLSPRFFAPPARSDNSTSSFQKGRVVALVVTYNRLYQLKKTLFSLLQESTDRLCAIVVVDNASDDDTLMWLRSLRAERLHIIAHDTNEGGSAGFAAAMEYALEHLFPDWLLLMDDDARPMPGAIRHFHNIECSVYDAIAAAVYHPDGRICHMNRPKRDLFKSTSSLMRAVSKGFTGKQALWLGEEDYAQQAIIPVEGASFVGLFLSFNAVKTAGMPERDFFIYGDDALYTLYLSRLGGRIGFAPTLHFEHDCKVYEKQQRVLPVWKVYFYYRNLLYVYCYMAGRFIFLLTFPLVITVWLFELRHYQPKERGTFLKLWARAVRDGLLRSSKQKERFNTL